MSIFRVIQASEISRSDWQSYVDSHAYGTVFHTPYLYDVWKSVPGYKPYALFAVKDGVIQALISGFFHTVAGGVLSFVSKRSVMLNGPLFSDITAFSALILAYNDYAKEYGALYTEIRNHYLDNEYKYTMPRLGYKWEGHYNIVKEIPDDTDALWMQIGRKRKDGINKGKRFDFKFWVEARSDTIESLHRLLMVKYKDLGLPLPARSFFENCKSLAPDGFCRFFHLIEDGVPKIVLLGFEFKGILHAVYIGIDQDKVFINKRPVDFFYYKVLEYCVENGIKYFDWMGAGKPGIAYGVRDFKLQYGGELEDFGRYQIAHKPLLMNIASKAFNLKKSIGERLRT